MGNLRDVVVDFVSLVDRAANRDPEDPLEPNRFLLRKSESRDDLTTTIRDEISKIEATPTSDVAPVVTPRKDSPTMATEDNTITEPSDVRAAAAAAILALNDIADQVDPGLLSMLAELSQHGLDETDSEDGENAAEKAAATVTKLAKVEEQSLKVAKAGDRENLRQAVAKARREVEERYLAAIRV